MKTASLFTAALLTAFAIFPSAAFAGCDPARWTNPSHFAQYPPVQGVDKTYLDQNPGELSGRVNADGNIQIITITFINDQDGVCTMDMVWEINCERQEARLLWSNILYDEDYPTDKDQKVEGDKAWMAYNTPTGVRRIGTLGNQFCSRKINCREYRLERPRPVKISLVRPSAVAALGAQHQDRRIDGQEEQASRDPGEAGQAQQHDE